MNKKKKESKWTKSKFSCLVFSTLLMVSRTNRVDLASKYQKEVGWSFCTPLLCISRSHSYTLCTGGHFEPTPSLTKEVLSYIFIFAVSILNVWRMIASKVFCDLAGEVDWYKVHLHITFQWMCAYTQCNSVRCVPCSQTQSQASNCTYPAHNLYWDVLYHTHTGISEHLRSVWHSVGQNKIGVQDV